MMRVPEATAPARFSVGLMDETCPPSTVDAPTTPTPGRNNETSTRRTITSAEGLSAGRSDGLAASDPRAGRVRPTGLPLTLKA